MLVTPRPLSGPTFLQPAFGTVSLNLGDWLVCVAVASSVLWLGELSKLFVSER
jgi:Ca2+-transporting ATPase